MYTGYRFSIGFVTTVLVILIAFFSLKSLVLRSDSMFAKHETDEKIQERKAKFEELSNSWPTRNMNIDSPSRFYRIDEECVDNPIRYYSPNPEWGCDVMQLNSMYKDVSRVVGKGGWRNVYAGKYEGKDVVLKRINFVHVILTSKYNNKKTYDKFRLEASIIENLKECQNVPHLLGYCGLDIVTEKLDDTLINEVKRIADQSDSVLRALQLSLDTARGLQCLDHIKYGPIVHGDLHAGQFLVDKHGTAYINDFDRSHPLSRSNVTGAPCPSMKEVAWYQSVPPHLSVNPIGESNATRDNSSSFVSHHELTYYGKPTIFNPDIVNLGLVSEKSDIYNLAGVIYFIISGQDVPPFKTRDLVLKYGPIYGMDIVDLLMDMWEELPELRPSADEVALRLSALLENIGPDRSTKE